MRNVRSAHFEYGNNFKNWGKLFGGTVPPNNTLFGRTVPPNKTLFGGTVPPDSTLFGGTPDYDKKYFISVINEFEKSTISALFKGHFLVI